jgi:superkiller protein 3
VLLLFQLLGQLSEAEHDFLEVLQESPDYVPALKGLGETYLSEARDYLDRQLFGCARDKSEKALTILTKYVL